MGSYLDNSNIIMFNSSQKGHGNIKKTYVLSQFYIIISDINTRMLYQTIIWEHDVLLIDKELILI
jgi:hypothetical protein